MSHSALEDAAPRLPSLSVIDGLKYTGRAQIFNRWLIPAYRTAFRWMGTRLDAEEATADVLSGLVLALALPAEVRLVDEQVNNAVLRAVTRFWSDRYDVR